MPSRWESADDEGKRRLVNQMLSLRGVNACGVVKILEMLEGVAVTREYVSKSLAEDASRVLTTLHLPLQAGGAFSWDVALPQQLLPHLFAKCEGFRAVFARSLTLAPCSFGRPWRLVLYHDEITPGNPLRPDNRRKIVAFYISFLELGSSFLRTEDAWLLLGTLRSSVVKNVLGGISNVTRRLLRALFLGPQGLRDGGIMLGDAQGLFFATFCRLLSDEAAGKAVWCVKGASGLRPCIDCENVVACRENSVVDFDDSGYLVDITCSDRTRFDPMSDQDLLRSHDLLSALKAAGVTRAEFERVEKGAGMTFNADGLLADAELRALAPPSTYARDPMHTMLANGVANVEIYAFLRAVAGAFPNFSYKTVQQFAEADWTWPKSRQKPNIASVFNEIREKASLKDQSFKAGAAEVLTILPLLRRFVEVAVAPTGQLHKEVASFLCMCRVVDLMQAVKRDCSESNVRLLNAEVDSAFRLHVEAYGCGLVKPKHHYMLHLTKQAESDGIYLDCFVHERKHQVIKHSAEHIKNTRVFERTVLIGSLNACAEHLCTCVPSGLVEPSQDCPVFAASLGRPCCVAKAVRVDFQRYDTGDILIGQNNGFVIKCCIKMGEEYGLVVTVMSLVDRLTLTTSVWQQDSSTLHVLLLPDPHVRHAACWHTRPDGNCVVLEP